MSTNLVPLLVDLNSGKYYTGTNSGSSSLSAFVYSQTSANTTWTITHNGNTKNVLVQVYDSSGNMVFPDTVVTTSVNVLTVTFADPQTGSAVLLLVN